MKRFITILENRIMGESNNPLRSVLHPRRTTKYNRIEQSARTQSGAGIVLEPS